MHNSPIALLWKTGTFLIIRFVVLAALLYPIYPGIVWGIEKGRDLFGINLFIADLAYGYCGLMISYLYLALIRTIILSFLRFSHVASMTDVLDGGSGSTLKSMKAVFGRLGTFLTVSTARVALRKTMRQLSHWIMTDGNFVPEFLKKGFFAAVLKSTVNTVAEQSLMVMTSYLFKHKELPMWEGMLKAITLYMKAWKQVLKAAVLNTLYLKVFGKVTNFLMFWGLVYYLWGQGITKIFVVYVTVKIFAWLLRTTVLEPYQTATMLVAFYEYMDTVSSDEEMTLDLASVSSGFTELIMQGWRKGDGYAQELAGKITGGLGSETTGLGDSLPSWIKDLGNRRGS